MYRLIGDRQLNHVVVGRQTSSAAAGRLELGGGKDTCFGFGILR